MVAAALPALANKVIRAVFTVISREEITVKLEQAAIRELTRISEEI